MVQLDLAAACALVKGPVEQPAHLGAERLSLRLGSGGELADRGRRIVGLIAEQGQQLLLGPDRGAKPEPRYAGNDSDQSQRIEGVTHG
jgi:hypothetical protein